MAKESKMRKALIDAAVSLISNGCDALIALDGIEDAEERAHDMVNWHFNNDEDAGEDDESSLSN